MIKDIYFFFSFTTYPLNASTTTYTTAEDQKLGFYWAATLYNLLSNSSPVSVFNNEDMLVGTTLFLRGLSGPTAATMGLLFFFLIPIFHHQGPFVGPSLIIARSIKLWCETMNQKVEISGLVWQLTQFVKQQTTLNSAPPNLHFAPEAALMYDFCRI